MPTAKGGYYLKDGSRVPSVTTLIKRFQDSGGLIAWAWKEGKEGRDYRDTRDRAATAGTLAHAAVEAWVNGRAWTPAHWIGATEEHGPEISDRAEKAYGAFLEWARQTQLKVTHTEVALVSERHRYGGTFDALLIGQKRAMGDWKSSDGIYPDYLLQVAAYGALWEEHHPDEPVDGGYHLLRFDKNHGDFHAHWWGELKTAWQAFLHIRALYDFDKELKARVK